VPKVNKNVVVVFRRIAFCLSRGQGSIPGQSIWDLWWTNWHWGRFLPEYFGFPLSISTGAPLLGKMKKLIIFPFIFIARVARQVLRLRCVRSFCCGDLLHQKKKLANLDYAQLIIF
jgi:hypothetical protein